MATARIIKRKIRTAKNIAQITRAMEMVAALKMRRAQEKALKARPYAEKAILVLANLLGAVERSLHPLLSIPEGQKVAVLLVTPNRGLCGALITNLFREILKFFSEKTELSFFTWGKRGKDFVLRTKFSLLADFSTAEPPTFEKATEVGRVIREFFLGGEFAKAYLVYSHFQTTLTQVPRISQILPLTPEIAFAVQEAFPEYIFEPEVGSLLEDFLPYFLEMRIYQVLLEAYASEQSARMMAMRAATENAKEIIDELTLTFNKARQQMITAEISDIVTAQVTLLEEK